MLSIKLFNLKTASLDTLFKGITTILFGLIVFYIDDRDFFDYRVTLGIIVAIAVLKCLYFISISYHKIMEVSMKDTAYYKFMLFMAMNIIIIIISFSTDFFCLVQVDPHSLKGIPPYAGFWERMFDCFYFSVLNFSFFGYADILPNTIPSKMIMMFEILISFMMVIIVLSDFISLKESLAAGKRKAVRTE